MKLELTVFELGKALKEIEERYKLNILIKLTLSGGWMTIAGKASILKFPSEIQTSCGKKDNIIDIKVESEDGSEGFTTKITGAKGKTFNVDISSTRYKELNSNNLSINQIKVNENESKLRIDENIIFTINAPVDEVAELIES